MHESLLCFQILKTFFNFRNNRKKLKTLFLTGSSSLLDKQYSLTMILNMFSGINSIGNFNFFSSSA